MRKLSIIIISLFLCALMACNSNILNDADSIKESGDASSRTASNTRTVTFNCQDATASTTDTLVTRAVSGSETTIGTLPQEPVKAGTIFAGWWTEPNGGGTAFNADTVVSADITVYARWSTIPVYLVTFNTNGGSQISVRKVTEGETFKSPGNPEKTGYLFGGWFCESSCVTPWNFDTAKVTADTVLYAKWDSYTWTVTFADTANSGYSATRTITSPATVTETLPDPVPNGSKNFAGWWTGPNGTGTQFTSSTPVTSDITVYVLWSADITYTVAFDAQGGTPVGTQTICAGKTAKEQDSTTREGYTFKGWFSAPNGKGKRFSSSLAVTENTTWYAFWGTYSFTVTFECDDATVPSKPAKITVETPKTTVEALPSQSPEKEGYIFGGWFTGKNGDGYEFTESSSVTDNITVHASWKSFSYTVTFNTGNGTNPTMTVESPHTSLGAFPQDPVRSGYIFNGWFTEPEGAGAQVNTTSRITANTTVYAKWIKACTITFDPNGGDGTMNSQTMVIGESTSLNPNAFTRAGFTFSGWALSSYGTSAYSEKSHYTASSSRVTLYATWTINTYSITFNANGGTGKMSDITMEYNKITSLNSNNFARSDYEFAGWATTPSGAVKYGNLAIYTMGPENITLYAVWKYAKSSPESFFIVKNESQCVTITGLSGEWNSGTGTSLVIPNIIGGAPVIALDPSIFDRSTKLESIGTDPANVFYATKDGVLFSKDMTTLYRYPEGKKDISYTVPKTVSSIKEGAFRDAIHLETIKLESEIPPALGRAAITQDGSNFKIIVPASAIDSYKKAYGWSVFANHIGS